MTIKEAIILLQEIEEDGWHVNKEQIEAINLAVKAFEFIEGSYPKTFIDYLNGVQI